jgi:SAM-dependent methyltransferase
MKKADKIRHEVSKTYSRAVEKASSRAEGCGCCGGPVATGFAAKLAGYGRAEMAALPPDAVVNSFGCGNPVALAAIREGDTVLDLGSGAGIDILLAAKITGPRGRVIGVDMTPAMIERARQNAAAAGLSNVEVREGLIEELPVESGSVDLVISNCVINLSPEKKKVFGEIARVLKPGGRISISDIVAEKLPEWVVELGALYSACITGAIPEAEYLGGLRDAGLEGVAVNDRLVYDRGQLGALLVAANAGDDTACCGGKGLPREKIDDAIEVLAGKVASVRVVGRKPGEPQPGAGK